MLMVNGPQLNPAVMREEVVDSNADRLCAVPHKAEAEESLGNSEVNTQVVVALGEETGDGDINLHKLHINQKHFIGKNSIKYL